MARLSGKKKIGLFLLVVAVIFFGATAAFHRWLTSAGFINNQPSGLELDRQADFLEEQMALLVRGKVFKSNDETLQLRYPESWFLTQLVPGSTPEEALESWRLTSFNPKEMMGGKIPDEGVRMDFQILVGANQGLDQVLGCENKDCQEIVSNGVGYKSLIEELSGGGQIVALVTERSEKIYRIVSYLGKSKDEKKALEEVQSIFETFTFLK